MTRNEFMWALSNALTGFPQSEISRVTEYYDELFNEGLDEGKTEEEICASLDKPEDIAERMRIELAFVRAEQQPTPKSMNAVLLILLGLFAVPIGIPLGAALLSVLFAMFVTVFALTFSFGAVVLALGVSGLAAVAAGVAVIAGGAPLFGIALFGAAFVLIGLGILGCLGTYYLTRAMMRGVVKLCRTLYNAVTNRKDKVGT